MPLSPTARQAELLRYIESCGAVSPSFDEMCEALGLRAKSGIFRLLRGLEDRGLIRRLPNRARAIEVLRPAKEEPWWPGFVNGPRTPLNLPLHGKID